MSAVDIYEIRAKLNELEPPPEENPKRWETALNGVAASRRAFATRLARASSLRQLPARMREGWSRTLSARVDRWSGAITRIGSFTRASAVRIVRLAAAFYRRSRPVATRGIAQAGRFTRQAVIAAARSARAAARALASLRWRGEAPRPEPQKVEEVETDPNAEELRHAQQRLAAKKRRLGYEHPDVAAELHLIGALHHEAARYAEAVASYNEALVIRERTLGPNHCEVAAALEDLAATRREQGDSQEAEALLERAGQIHAIYEEMLLQGEAAAARSA